MEKRAAYRQEYGSTSASSVGRKNLDYWMRQNTTKSFRQKQVRMTKGASLHHETKVSREEWQRDARIGKTPVVCFFLVVFILLSIFSK